MTSPAVDTARVGRTFLRRREKSTSVPTTNRNRTSPRLAMSERYGIESLGKMLSVKPGIWPNAVGPRRIPARISETTRGCRAHLKANARILDRIRIRHSWTITRTSGLCGAATISQRRRERERERKRERHARALVGVDSDRVDVSAAEDGRRVPACHCSASGAAPRRCCTVR